LTLGLFRPVILLPPGRADWPAEARALILGHELAHVRRRDFLAGLLIEWVKCLCWLHPLVLWLAARLRLEQEYAADGWVARAFGSHDYVRCLARLALERDQGRGPLAPALWRRRPEILRRIDMLQRNPNGLPSRLSKRAAALVVLFAAAACLAVAGVGPLRSAAPLPAPADPGAGAKVDPHGDPLPAGALARLGTTRFRHAAAVTFVAFAADGKLLTAGRDNTIRLWDLEGRKEVRRFARPTPAAQPLKEGGTGKLVPARAEALLRAQAQAGGTFQVALTADGKVLAAAGFNVVRLWDVSTGNELRTIEGPNNGLFGLTFSPDGRTLAGRGGDGSLFLWSAETGKQLHHLKPAPRPRQDTFALAFGGGRSNSPAPGLAFTPDGKALVAAVTDYVKDQPVRSVKFFDVSSGKEVRKVEAPKGARVWSTAVTRDGKLLAYAAGNVVHIHDLSTDKEAHKITTPDGVHFLAFSADGQTLAVRGLNERIRLWDTGTGKERHQLNDAERPARGNGFVLVTNNDFGRPEVRAVAFSPDDKRVAGAAGGTVRVWEAATGKEIALVESHWRAPSAVVLSPDGKTAVSWAADRVVRRWDAQTGKPLGSFPAPAGTRLATFSPDGRTVALANADNTVGFYDTLTGKKKGQLASGHARGVAAMAFAPGGKVLATRGLGDNVIRLHDLDRGALVRELTTRPAGPPARARAVVFGRGRPASHTGPGLAFSPDGKLVAVPAGDARSNTILFLDAASGKELRKITSPRPVTSFAFSPDSRSLAAENADGTVTLWEVASARPRGQLGTPVVTPPRGGSGSSGSGSFVVTVNGVNFDGGGDPVGPVGVTFSPDGRAVVVRGRDPSLRVWDVAAGKEVAQLRGHAGPIQAVAFSADGKALASGSADTTALLWDAAAALKGLAKPQARDLTAAEAEAAWGDLAGEDAEKARLGVSRLVAGAKQSVPFLGTRLKPAVRIDPKKIGGWITDLDSEKFRVRQEATAQLVKAGEQAVPALKKLLASGPPLETRRRAEELVDRLTSGTLTTEQLRVVRAVEALEQVGTAEARRLLQALADGGPGALPTREARTALDRLAATRP
jgi:WD40 repeat protein